MSSLRTLPNKRLNERCSNHFRWQDLIICGETMAISDISNTPESEKSWDALANLARFILDPLVDHFGRINLTYCFSSKALSSLIKSSIAPRRDQHASHETSANGKLVCTFGGAAADFISPSVSSSKAATFVIQHLPFDALYFYGDERPIHVSWSEKPRGLIVDMKFKENYQRHFPVRRTAERFLELYGQ